MSAHELYIFVFCFLVHLFFCLKRPNLFHFLYCIYSSCLCSWCLLGLLLLTVVCENFHSHCCPLATISWLPYVWFKQLSGKGTCPLDCWWKLSLQAEMKYWWKLALQVEMNYEVLTKTGVASGNEEKMFWTQQRNMLRSLHSLTHTRVGRLKTNKETNKQIKKKAKIPPGHQSPHLPTAGTENLPLPTESLAMPKTASATSRKGYHTWQQKSNRTHQNKASNNSHKPGKWITELVLKIGSLLWWTEVAALPAALYKKSRGK